MHIEKVFDTILWSFVQSTMHCMGFGAKVSEVIYYLYKNSSIACILDEEIANAWILFNLCRQGCLGNKLL